MVTVKMAATEVVSSDLLSEHKIKPWWETIHGYLLATTITASGLIVYFTTSGQQVDCIPISENASIFTDSQVNLMNGYCTGEIPWYALYCGIVNFVSASVILVASNVWLNHPDVIDAFRTFVKAANIINGLHSRLKNLNRMAITPVLVEDGEAFELRKACLLLWCHRNRIQKLYLCRNTLVIFMTTLAFVCTSWMTVMMTSLVVNPHFNCSLSPTLKEELQLALRGRYDYFCSYNYAKIMFPFVLLSGLAFLGQVCALAIAMYKLRSITPNPCDKATFSDELLQARSYCHFMKVFWTNASPVDLQRLEGLLNYIFSPDAITSMVRYIPMAITNTQTVEEPTDFLPLNHTQMQTLGSLTNSDLTYIELYVRMHRNGGNNALSKLYKLFKDRDFGTRYVDITNALTKVEFTQWNNDAKSFIKAAVERRYWDLVVNILNSFKDSNPTSEHPEKLNCDLYDFDLDVRDKENNDGCNVLYYALRKEEGESDFKWTAIKHILACNIGKGKLIVHAESTTMTADEFVLSQYEQDPTFPENLKMQLISMIQAANSRDLKYTTIKI